MGNNIQNITPANVRIDYTTSGAYIGPEAPKHTFFQKLGRGLAKFMNFAGPIGAAVSAVALGPIGIPVAAGLYGLTKFSQDKLYQAQIKDEIDMASQSQQNTIVYPGLFETQTLSAGEQVTEFIAPNSFQADISQVIIQRDAAQQEALGNF